MESSSSASVAEINGRVSVRVQRGSQVLAGAKCAVMELSVHYTLRVGARTARPRI